MKVMVTFAEQMDCLPFPFFTFVQRLFEIFVDFLAMVYPLFFALLFKDPIAFERNRLSRLRIGFRDMPDTLVV